MRVLEVVTIALALGTEASISGAGELRPTGVVTATTAEFSIPMTTTHDGIWDWNQAKTSDNALEYRWDIRVRSAGEEYNFGFYKFKYPGANERRGSLEDLLSVGQASLWKKGAPGRGGSVVKGARVSVSVDNGAMLVQITDVALVRLLFVDRPATASALTKTPETGETVEELPIAYRQ